MKKLFEIQWRDPETEETLTQVRYFDDSPEFTASLWAEDCAYTLADKGWHQIKELAPSPTNRKALNSQGTSMSTLDELIDTPIKHDISGANAAPPEGKAQATLVEYGQPRPVTGKDGQLYEILPAFFLIEGDQYNSLAGRESMKVKYELWLAMDENGSISDAKADDGTSKNARMARFFKAFGKSTKGSRFTDLVGGTVTIGLKPEKDQNDEYTGFARVTFVGAAR